jgi:antirestriction protein ArdC
MQGYSTAARAEKSDAYARITERIVEALERGVVPWRCPWDRYRGLPRNLTSGKEYRGVNVFLLAIVRQCTGYESPYWLTYKQAQERGGHVRKGEKGTGIVFWMWLDRETGETDDDGQPETDRVPLLRQYTVFNVDQCDGIEPPATADVQRHDWEPLAECERIVSAMPNAPEIRVGTDRACYIPRVDRVEVPHRHRFAQPAAFYGTLFHELTHATGHEKRLNRRPSDEPRYFGDPDYSREELVAEMGAAFLCGHVGIETETLDQSAAYLRGWIDVLKGDGRLVVTAAAQAQKAADYILDRRFGG